MAANGPPARPHKPRTIFLLRLLQLNLYNRLVARLRPFGLTPLQYMVLSISGSRGTWSTAELARRFDIAPQSMTEVISSLEKMNLIARSKSAEHGRILNIRLTAAGARILEKCDRAVDRLERDAFAGFSAEELAAFRTFLNTALARIRRPPRRSAHRIDRRAGASAH